MKNHSYLTSQDVITFFGDRTMHLSLLSRQVYDKFIYRKGNHFFHRNYFSSKKRKNSIQKTELVTYIERAWLRPREAHVMTFLGPGVL